LKECVLCNETLFLIKDDFSLVCYKCGAEYVIAIVKTNPTGWSMMKKSLVLYDSIKDKIISSAGIKDDETITGCCADGLDIRVKTSGGSAIFRKIDGEKYRLMARLDKDGRLI